MPVKRLDANPLLTPDDVSPTRDGLEVMCTFNPGAVRFGEEILLLVRVGERPVPEAGWISYVQFNARSGRVEIKRISEDDPDLAIRDGRTFEYQGRMLLSSMGHLRIARSKDGVNFKFDDRPAIFPATAYEAYGCEDPRITHVDGRYYIAYTAVSDRGVMVAMASTEDFVSYERHGIIFPPFQKDVTIFPERVGGLYVCRHRPHYSPFNLASIWTAYSPDLACWGLHEMTLAPAAGTWRSARVGCGAAPVRTDDGWLDIFHAADEDGRYHLGAMLSDLDEPHRIISSSSRPVLSPEAPYEQAGIYGNCVFSNGLIVDEDGRVTIYYGAADRICAAAVTTVAEMVSAARE